MNRKRMRVFVSIIVAAVLLMFGIGAATMGHFGGATLLILAGLGTFWFDFRIWRASEPQNPIEHDLLELDK